MNSERTEPTADPAKTPQERVSAVVRREQILAAASRVFGERGYVGATTDQVAQAAGISQPYVVRMFGSKENLFVEVLDRALGKLLDAFRDVLISSKAAGDDQEMLMRRLGAAYADLIVDRGILMSLMQGFVAGHEPAIGAEARAGFMGLYALLRNEAGFEPDQIVDFLAHGMLFNTLIAMRMLDVHASNDPCIPELLAHTFGTKLDIVMKTVLGTAEDPAAHATPARATA
jgi:TetR/AcrR family transcriptional regulator